MASNSSVSCHDASDCLITVLYSSQAGAEQKSHEQSKDALQQQVVQQQADIARLEKELAALHSHFGSRYAASPSAAIMRYGPQF